MRTAQQKQNMETHIKFLRDNADKIRDRFDMRYVSQGGCHCAFGFIPESLGIEINKCGGILTKDLEIFGMDSNEGKYCFGGGWWSINNTPEAAAARMEAVLYNQHPKNIECPYSVENAHPIVNVPQPKEQIIKNALSKIKAMMF